MSYVTMRTPVVAFTADLSGAVSYIEEDAWEAISPIPASVVTTNGGWARAIYREDLDDVRAAWKHSLLYLKPFDMAYRIYGYEGPVWVHGRLDPISIDGRMAHWQGSVILFDSDLHDYASNDSIRPYISDGTKAAQCSGNLYPGVKGVREPTVTGPHFAGISAMKADKRFALVIFDQAQVKDVADRYLPEERAIRRANKFNSISAGTSLWAAAVPHPISKETLRAIAASASAYNSVASIEL